MASLGIIKVHFYELIWMVFPLAVPQICPLINNSPYFMHHSIILFYFILFKPIYLNTHTHKTY